MCLVPISVPAPKVGTTISAYKRMLDSIPQLNKTATDGSVGYSYTRNEADPFASETINVAGIWGKSPVNQYNSTITNNNSKPSITICTAPDGNVITNCTEIIFKLGDENDHVETNPGSIIRQSYIHQEDNPFSNGY